MASDFWMRLMGIIRSINLIFLMIEAILEIMLTSMLESEEIEYV